MVVPPKALPENTSAATSAAHRATHPEAPLTAPERLRLTEYWCALSELGTRKLRRQGRSAGALDALWQREGARRLSPARRQQLREWFEGGGKVLFVWESGFPDALRHIPDAPVALFLRGSVLCFEKPRVAMVGSRAASHSGVALARQLAATLSRAGVCVVSGLAQGIDCAAHAGALSVQCPTVAIPGSGLDNLYPRSHTGLAQEILAAGGILLSEYAPWVAPRPATFPARNRLISGLAAGVVVVQAAHRSGSLITARLAAEQGREVMAVPGVPGTAVAAGCNQLLRDGAALIESAEDVFAALGWAGNLVTPQSASQQRLQSSADSDPDSDRARVLAAIDSLPVSLDALTQFVGLPPGQLQSAVLQLELEGLVRATARGYIRAS